MGHVLRIGRYGVTDSYIIGVGIAAVVDLDLVVDLVASYHVRCRCSGLLNGEIRCGWLGYLECATTGHLMPGARINVGNVG